jgi:N12 class adenine-specific DNA methylase
MPTESRTSRWQRKPIPDYTNQLDLFADTDQDSPAEGTATQTVTNESERIDERQEPIARRDPESLDHSPSPDGEGTAAEKPVDPVAPRDGGADDGSAVRAAVGPEDELRRSLGDSDAGMGAPADRGPPTTAIVHEFEPEPTKTTSRDFRINDAHRIGEGSLREKAKDNLAAIRILKEVEGQGRDASEEEKAQLARYSGWGALANAFLLYPPPEWQQINRELKALLSDVEYTAARASTPNAHFTSPMVIKAMWDAMERLGLPLGATILEPSMGVGHFFGLMPPSLEQDTRRTGVELDLLTARIAQRLYPDATIFAKAFEETRLPDNYFDAAIGNIPFGNYAVYDPDYKPVLTRAIHDYFFAKSLDKVRTGGVLALITSRYTMDKQDSTIRSYLAERANLMGAIRLPNSAFKANAGTEVTTDILFLQKRTAGTPAAGESWCDLAAHDTAEYGQLFINEYFARNPHLMLGRMVLEGSMYRGNEPTLDGDLTPDLLARAVSSIPAGIMAPRPRSHIVAAIEPADFDAVKEGAFALRDGKLTVRNGATFDPVNLSSTADSRVRGMMAVRDAVRAVFQSQLDDAPEERITETRRRLNEVYDDFQWRHGPLSSRENIKSFAGDPDHPLLLSLENYDAEKKRATKTAIFDRRTLERYKPVEHVETAAEALTVSLNETGDIAWPRMEILTGRTSPQLQRELGSLAYRNPNGGQWETADRYLSGDVRAKLRTAQSAAELDPTYQRNIAALSAVQPVDLEPGEIEARLGSSWIPTSDIRDFIAQTLEAPDRHVRVAHAGAIATWTVEIDSASKWEVSNTTTHGTERFKASDLIDQALNGRTPTAYDEMEDGSRVVNQRETIAAREKQQQLKDRFREWVWKDGERATRLAREYNDRFNNLRLRQFEGSHLTFPGMNREVLRNGDLDKHQKDAVWRVLQGNSTLLAHCVGAGKSFEMAAAAMELRRMGLAKKPMIVVPNHLVEQMGSEFLRLYPNAKLFVAGREHFAAGNRQKAMARIAGGNYDAVIVSHRSFEFLPVSDRLFEQFMQEEMDKLEEAILEAKAEKGDNRRIVKELEKAKKRFATKLKQRADRENKDNTISFEELGVDQLFVDEADLYKNLFYTTKMNRIAGLPNTDSNRAFDMYMKTRYVRQINDGRGVVFATGTPISNTMAELYTMLRYLAPDLLRERGVEHFDAWAANFAEAVTALELAPDGSGYRMHTRFAKFINLPELLSMFRTVADVQTADMLKLPRPTLEGGRPQGVAAPGSPGLKAFVESLVQRSEKLRSQRVDPSVDNMLKITGDGRKAALDMRLVDPFADPHGDSKLSRVVSRIHDNWETSRAERSTQLVFCDLSTPSTDKFNVYHEVRHQLEKCGVPANEIAFIHDADTDAAKKVLFDSVNAGRIRVLIGSTEKMGAGTNVQRKLIALHHLDAPWRPRDIEQREGRILRQGNLNREVRIFRYVTEGSFDAYMWQTLETKARFIQQVMTGATSVRQAEDIEGGALTYAEIKAIASGNPAVMEKVKVDTEIRKLDQLRAAHVNQQYSIRTQLSGLPGQIQHAKANLARIRADIATRDANTEDEFHMTVGKKVFSGKGAREEAAKALNHVVLSWRDDLTLQPRAAYRGFEILSRGRGTLRFGDTAADDHTPELFVRGAAAYSANLNAENPVGTVQSIEHTLRALDRHAESDHERIERLEKQLADYQAQANKPYEHEARLKELLIQQAQLNAALDLDKGEQQAAPEESSEGQDAPAHAPESFAARVLAERALAMLRR